MCVFISLPGIQHTRFGEYIYTPAGVTLYSGRRIYLSASCGYIMIDTVGIFNKLLVLQYTRLGGYFYWLVVVTVYKVGVVIFIGLQGLQHTKCGAYIYHPAGDRVYKVC